MSLSKEESSLVFLNLYKRYRGIGNNAKMDRELTIILTIDDTKVRPENLHEYMAIALDCSRDKGKEIARAYYSARDTYVEINRLLKRAYDHGRLDAIKGYHREA